MEQVRPNIQQLCVFCGSSSGARPEYLQAAQALGERLGQKGITLVYGGAGVGLMGRVAKACLEAGGKAIGVIPRKMVELELACPNLTRLHVVETMHERKAMMAELSDGFIALPGGLGTIEELFEVLTWAQLGLHQKPCGLLNVGGYYDHLISFLDQTVAEQFVQAPHRRMIQIDDRSDRLLEKLAAYQAPPPSKVAWILGMRQS